MKLPNMQENQNHSNASLDEEEQRDASLETRVSKLLVGELEKKVGNLIESLEQARQLVNEQEGELSEQIASIAELEEKLQAASGSDRQPLLQQLADEIEKGEMLEAALKDRRHNLQELGTIYEQNLNLLQEQDSYLANNGKKQSIGSGHRRLLPRKISRSLLKGKTALIAGLALFLSLGGGGLWLFTRKSADTDAATAQQQNPPVAVKLTTLQTTNLQDSTDVLGSLEARQAVSLKAEVDGRITEIKVKEGEFVRQGQIIATLDSDELRAELLQSKARLSSETARLAELEAGSRVEEVARARAELQEAERRLQDAQSGAQPEEIARARAQVRADEADARLASQRAERYAAIREEGAISADQYQEYLTGKQRAIANLESARRLLSQLEAARRSSIGELTAAAEQARQKLRLLENGSRPEEIAQARANAAAASASIKLTESKLDKTQIRAPISGIVGNIPLKLGSYLEAGDSITAITENDTLELNLSIPLEKLTQLRVGLPVEILDNQNQAIAEGKISFISPNATSDSQLVLAKADFANVRNALLNQQFIQARIIWDRRPGLVVPASAISRIGAASFVFVAKPAGVAQKSAARKPPSELPSTGKANSPPALVVEQRQVTLGSMQGNNYQVLSGLKAGEKIVTAGILQLRDGAPIQPLPPQGRATVP
jgi:multidrug efflux pump subunit AcrA (membrane-fusion protein)